MKRLMVFTIVLCLGCVAWASNKADVQDRLDNAAKVLREIQAAPDTGIPDEILAKAKCVAVVPHMLKAGFGIGGEHGKGAVTCRTSNGWSAPALFTITGGSFGFQIGGEGVDLVMLAMNDTGMQKLMNDKIELGADASVAAGPVGRHASADTDIKLNAEILTYSRTKGAFAGVALKGAVLRQDKDSTESYYGRDIPNQALLTGKVPPPSGAHAFLNVVAHSKAVAVNKEKND
jgi:lipid-binding SYLF domain-containing protein